MLDHKVTIHQKGQTVEIEGASMRAPFTHPTFIERNGKQYMYLSAYWGDGAEGIYEIKKIVDAKEINYEDKSLEG